jgi:hypothetical protein
MRDETGQTFMLLLDLSSQAGRASRTGRRKRGSSLSGRRREKQVVEREDVNKLER